MKRKRIALIGMTGCGKSTVGKILAELSGIDFYDLDREIEKTCKMTVKEIFEKEGEEAFRKKEHECLSALLENGNMILACGGGTVLSEENRKLLASFNTVFLSRKDFLPDDPEVLMRPPIYGSAEKYAELYAKRLPLYRMTANVEIENNDAKAAAERIFGLYF